MFCSSYLTITLHHAVGTRNNAGPRWFGTQIRDRPSHGEECDRRFYARQSHPNHANQRQASPLRGELNCLPLIPTFSLSRSRCSAAPRPKPFESSRPKSLFRSWRGSQVFVFSGGFLHPWLCRNHTFNCKRSHTPEMNQGQEKRTMHKPED
jgi:hypothetical protein